MTDNVKRWRRIRGRHLFAIARPLLMLVDHLLRVLPAGISRAGLSLSRNVPGYLGLAVRYAFVRRLAVRCGDNVAIYPGVFLFDVQGLSLGSNVKIGEMCFLGAGGGIEIADDVSLAHATSVLTEEHDYTAPGPLRETPLTFKRVRIDTGVWVGAGVRVLAGAEIGARTAVGAGAVVSGTLPADCVAVGVPARVLRARPVNSP